MSDWHLVKEMTRNAKGMYWDGCHKIYLAMDEAEKAKMIGYGYEHHEPDFYQLKGWYEESCGLRFVNAVFTNPDANAGFVTLIPQAFEEDE